MTSTADPILPILNVQAVDSSLFTPGSVSSISGSEQTDPYLVTG